MVEIQPTGKRTVLARLYFRCSNWHHIYLMHVNVSSGLNSLPDSFPHSLSQISPAATAQSLPQPVHTALIPFYPFFISSVTYVTFIMHPSIYFRMYVCCHRLFQIFFPETYSLSEEKYNSLPDPLPEASFLSPFLPLTSPSLCLAAESVSNSFWVGKDLHCVSL